IRDFHVTGVQTCALPISTEDQGVDELVDVLDKHQTWMANHGELERRNRASALARIRWAASDLALARVAADPDQLDAVVDKVLAQIGRASCRGRVEVWVQA